MINFCKLYLYTINREKSTLTPVQIAVKADNQQARWNHR